MFNTSIRTEIITTKEARDSGAYKWYHDSDPKNFYGYIPGYVCGFCVEVIKHDATTDVIDYCSCTFTNDFEYIHLPEDNEGKLTDRWNDLGISANWSGWEPTGRIVFRGYYSEVCDWDEREEYYVDKTSEVEYLMNKYSIRK